MSRPPAWKIALVLGLSLLGLALLPIVTLPYDRLDWARLGPIYRDSYGRQAEPGMPTVAPTPGAPGIPCAELPVAGAPLAAAVNGQPIGQATFEREMGQFLAAAESTGANLGSEDAYARLPAWRRQVLDLLIDDVLVQQAAVTAGITVTAEELSLHVTAFISSSGGLGWYQQWLTQTQQTDAEVERDLCQDRLYRAVRDWATAGVTAAPETVWARQIVVATEDEAQAALARLESGEPFVLVAQAISLDTETRRAGGSLGWFSRGSGQVAPEVEAAAFAGAPGEISGPLAVNGRYVLVQTLRHEPDVPPQATGDEEERRSAAFRQWLEEQRARAQIEVYIDVGQE